MQRQRLGWGLLRHGFGRRWGIVTNKTPSFCGGVVIDQNKINEMCIDPGAVKQVVNGGERPCYISEYVIFVYDSEDTPVIDYYYRLSSPL